MIQTDSSATIVPELARRFASLIRLVGGDPAVALDKLLSVASIVSMALVAWILFRKISRRYEDKLAAGTDEALHQSAQRAHTVVQLVNSVFAVGITVTSALLVLNLFLPIGPLIAGVGVFGLALSFGAQSLVKDVISGFFILVENQFSVGDIVEIAGTSGAVERITLRVVMLRDLEGVLHVIPNGSIDKVSNRTRGFARVVIDVAVAYREDVDYAMEVLGRVAGELRADGEWASRLIDDPTVMGVQELSESSVNIRILAAVHPGKQWDVKRELLRRIKARFDRDGIEIPFPQRTLHVHGPGVR